MLQLKKKTAKPHEINKERRKKKFNLILFHEKKKIEKPKRSKGIVTERIEN